MDRTRNAVLAAVAVTFCPSAKALPQDQPSWNAIQTLALKRLVGQIRLVDTSLFTNT